MSIVEMMYNPTLTALHSSPIERQLQKMHFFWKRVYYGLRKMNFKKAPPQNILALHSIIYP